MTAPGPADAEPGPKTRARAWPMLVTAVVLLALGALVASQVAAALGLSAAPVDVPREALRAAAAQPDVPPPLYRRIVVPDDPRTQLAARTLARAIVAAGGRRPMVTLQDNGVSPAVLTTVAGDLSASDQAYRVARSGADLAVTGATATAAASGLYAVADRIRSGRAVVPPGENGTVIVPRLQLRLTDAGAVGITADEAAFRAGTDYGLSTAVIGSALLPDAPYVDQQAVREIARQFRRFVANALALGYNGVIVPGFLEYVTFADVGSGHDVYPAGDPHSARALALARTFAPVWRYADTMGMKVFFGTDMLALSPPLKQYLTATYGGLAVTDAAFWSVYQAALTEFFRRMPYAAGLMVRIGEGGAVYQMPDWDITSEIAVTTPDAVRTMLQALLDTAATAGKDIIFRSWTVGVGAVGHLHTSPEAYEQVLGDLNAANLIVSTKFTAGDFYSHLPLNPTLAIGDQKRIIEFQARREFEGFGSLPNDLGPLTKEALNHFLDANPNVIGVWNWTQDGGPLRAGPMTLYLRHGFWQLFGLNTYAAGRLAWDPDADPAEITQDWARQTFSDDPATVAAITEAMALSREAITKGLYIGPYADQSVKALGLEPPPMMWIFEWDILTGDSAALDSIYAVSRGQVDEALAEGEQAVDTARRMRDLVAGTDPSTWGDPAQYQQFVDTLDYQVSLFETLAAYREMVLRHAQWLDTGDPPARAAWAQARDRYEAARDQHVATYTRNTALPAYNFTAADIGLQRAELDPLMAWLARLLLLLLVGVLALGTRPGQRLLRHGTLPGAAAARGLWLGLSRPWRLRDLAPVPTTTDRLLVWLVPAAALVLSRGILTWFLAPAHLAVVLGAWLLFGAAVRWFARRGEPFLVWAGVGGAVLLRVVILLLALVARGPGGYWFAFWTAPTARGIYLTVAFAAFLWVFAVTAVMLRDHARVSMRGAIGRTAVAIGVPLLAGGAVVAAIGLERGLTVWNDQLALLPWGLSRILGITVYLGIPGELPLLAAAAGGLLVGVGALLAIRSTQRPSWFQPNSG